MITNPYNPDISDFSSQCVCDLFPKPRNVVGWACSSPNCKYMKQNPLKLGEDFNGDFRDYFKLHGKTSD